MFSMEHGAAPMIEWLKRIRAMAFAFDAMRRTILLLNKRLTLLYGRNPWLKLTL